MLTPDPDDVMHPWSLQLLVARALAPDMPDIVAPDNYLFGAYTEYRSSSDPMEIPFPAAHLITGTSLFKRKLWEATGGQNTMEVLRTGNEDTDFYCHCEEICGPLSVANVPLPLTLYRRHPESQTSKQSYLSHVYRHHCQIVDNHPALFQKYGTAQQYQARFLEISIVAARNEGDWKEVLAILRAARQRLPIRLFFSLLARVMSTPMWCKLRHLGRVCVLDPLGLFPKKTGKRTD